MFEAFLAEGHREVHGTRSAWGSARLDANEYLTLGRGPGWHGEKARFDRFLAREAARAGAQVEETGFREASRDGDGWLLDVGGGATLRARFVVDATGRPAVFARRWGATFDRIDTLIGFGRFATEREPLDPGTMVEAVAQGWWYTAGLPGGRRFFACMTDADLGREFRLSDPATWLGHLDAAPHVRSILSRCDAPGPISAHTCEMRRMSTPAGDGWLAVGDAASVFDPLSSLGITKALRAGIFAAYAIGDHRLKQDGAAIRRYGLFQRVEYETYLATRREFYRQETRWPDREFWRRRAGPEPIAASGLPGPTLERSPG